MGVFLTPYRNEYIFSFTDVSQRNVIQRVKAANGDWINVSDEVSDGHTPTSIEVDDKSNPGTDKTLKNILEFRKDMLGDKALSFSSYHEQPYFSYFRKFGRWGSSGLQSQYCSRGEKEWFYPIAKRGSTISELEIDELLKYTGNVTAESDANDADTFVIHIGRAGSNDERRLKEALDARNIQKANIHTYAPGELDSALAAFKAHKADNPNANCVITISANIKHTTAEKDNNTVMYLPGSSSKGTEKELAELREAISNTENTKLVTINTSCNGGNLLSVTA